MHPELLYALNTQIKQELEAEYKYLALAILLEQSPFKNSSKWFYKQAAEEREHAYKIIKFLQSVDEEVELFQLNPPSLKLKEDVDLVNVFQLALNSEKEVTASINNIYEKALTFKSFKVQVFLHWFIEEQVEEEDSINNIIDQIKHLNQSEQVLFDLNFNV